MSNDHTNINCLANDRKSDSRNNSQLSLTFFEIKKLNAKLDNWFFRENKANHKLYPQRNNRAKLNYRDLERGMYEEIRQTMWALNDSILIEKNGKRGSNNRQYRASEPDIIDLTTSESKNSNDIIDKFNHRRCCIYTKLWNNSKLMLQCNSCNNWYHQDW